MIDWASFSAGIIVGVGVATAGEILCIITFGLVTKFMLGSAKTPEGADDGV